jgi:small subunit ribosomal protein S1
VVEKNRSRNFIKLRLDHKEDLLDFSETNLLEVDATTSTPKEETKEEKWFEQLVEDYDYESPKRGQILEGQIIRIDEDAILVGVGLKRDAIIPGKDLNNVDDKILENLSPGDKIIVSVLRPPVGDQDLLVSLQKGIEYESWQKAEQYLETGEMLELEVVGHNRGGLLVTFESLRGFLPYSQVPELRRIRDRQRAEQIKREMVGTELPVKVIEVNRKRRRLIFSARAAQEERREKRLKELEVGQIIRGPVVNIVKFGVFVDLDGVDGLVHISKLDWQRVNHPSDLFKVGDEIEVKVIDVDVERERVSLDRKSLQPSPWDNFEQNHSPGETLEGRVTNVLDFGAFVELVEGVEGLVHVSEIGYSSTGRPQDVVRPGDRVLVRILDIDTDRERISLSMRQVPLERQIAWSLEHSEQESEEAAETQTTEASEAGQEAEAELEQAETAAEEEQPAEVEAEQKETVEAEVEAEPEEQAETEAEPVAQAETEPEAQAEAEAQDEAEPEAQAEAEPEAQVEVEAEAQAEAEPEAQVEAEAEAQAEAEPEAQVEAEAEAQAEAEPEVQAEAEAQAEAEPEEQAEAEAEAEPEAQAEAEPEVQAEEETEDSKEEKVEA